MMLQERTRCSPFLLFALCFAALVLGACSSRAASPAEGQEKTPLSAEQLVDRMAEAFKGVRTLQAVGWTHLVERRGGEIGVGESAFEVTFGRPNRLSYKTWQQGGGFLVVWNGSTGWISALGTNQYQKQEGLPDLLHYLPVASAVLNLSSLPLSYIRNLLLPDPKAGILEGVTQAQVESPENASTYSLVLSLADGEVVTFFVRKEDFLPRGILFDLTEVVRKQAAAAGRTVPTDYNSRVTVTFTDAKVNHPVEETAFAFTPPEGAELVTRFGPQPLTGKSAPGFALNDLSGKPVTLSALRGGVVLLSFWATSCPVCPLSMAALEKLHQEFRGKGLTVLGISNEEQAPVEAFLKEHNLTFTILLDPKGEVFTGYQVLPIPRTLIIDREGKVAADFTALQEESALRAELAKLGIK